MTKELIEEGRVVNYDLCKVIVVDIKEGLILVQPQIGCRANGVVQLEPDYIARVEKPTVLLLRTGRCSGGLRIVNTTECNDAIRIAIPE